jgi:DNA primase
VIDQAVRDRNLLRPADKAAAVEEALPFVRAVRNRIQRREYFDIAMDALRVQTDQRRELWQQTKTGASVDAAGVLKVVTRTAKRTVAEEKLLELLLTNEELRKLVLPRLENADYEDLASAAIFRALVKLNAQAAQVSLDALSEETGDDPLVAELLPRLISKDQSGSFDEALGAADSCLDALRLMKLDRRIEEVGSELAEAERAGETDACDRLSSEHLELSKRRGEFLPRAQSPKNQI